MQKLFLVPTGLKTSIPENYKPLNCRLWCGFLTARGWKYFLSEPGFAGLVDFQDFEFGTPTFLLIK